MKLKKDNVYGFLIIHLIAGLAVFPWFFSWTGVVLLVAGLFVFGMLGINLCFHRLLTHRSFSCPLWLERSLATLAVCSVQDSPPHWVAVHRKHHQFADEEQDPHSPLVSFFWAHMGWLLVKVDDMKRGPLIERYAKDISRDRYYAWLERRSNWLKVALLSWLGVFRGWVYRRRAFRRKFCRSRAVRPELVDLGRGAADRRGVAHHLVGQFGDARLGLSQLRTRPTSAATTCWSRCSHPAKAGTTITTPTPRSARHGHKWWELDLTWLTIRLLMLLGLAKNVALPSPILADKFNAAGPRSASGSATPAISDREVSLAPTLQSIHSENRSAGRK